MVKERDKYEEMSWKVPDTKYCLSGRVILAQVNLEGYHRVMVKRAMKHDMVTGL